MEVLPTSKATTKHVMPKIYKPNLKEYEWGKRSTAKYIGTFRTKKQPTHLVVSMVNASKFPIVPFLLLFLQNKLIPFIKNIPIGTVYSVYDKLCDGLAEDEKVQGCYRNLRELLLKLARFCLCNSKMYSLVWFDEPNKFYVSLSGNGAPFGKYDMACSWLVGFLNLGKGILSGNENYLLFGANCSENCVPVQRFIKQLMLEVNEIEKTTFLVCVNGMTVQVKFYFAELPNDVKMLAFLAGELSNSAKYFSSFATVSTDNCNKVDGTFGGNTTDSWKAWDYGSRVAVAKSVNIFKKKVESNKKIKENTKHSKITTFIPEKQSRQEFVPLVGSLIDRAHVEPLHLKNNVCALTHRYLLNHAIRILHLTDTVTLFSHVPPGSPFGKYITAMRTKCKLSRLVN